MKNINRNYWIATILLAALMLLSAIPNVLMVADSKEFMHDHLGYPLYLIPFVGVAKILGVIAILIPGYSRIKEWAYAGLTFDLGGAIFSIIAVGDSPSDWMPILLGLGLIALSYFYYHKKLTGSKQ